MHWIKIDRLRDSDPVGLGLNVGDITLRVGAKTSGIQELDNLEREAFESLVKEKLAANESFRIFTDLMARLRKDLSESPDTWQARALTSQPATETLQWSRQ